MRRELAVTAALCVAWGSWAQQAPDFLPGTMGKPTTDPEWREVEVPPPPPLRSEGLVSVEGGSPALQFGIDPDSVAVGKDNVVRYVIVARSGSGAINAMYEGILCERGEYRVYARHTGAGWHAVQTEWKSLFDGIEARHVRAIARGGACQGRAPNGNAAQIVRDLRAPQDRKFGASGAP
jgi:hypothetical protein